MVYSVYMYLYTCALCSIKTSLHGAQDKVERLETKLAQVLVEKNSKIKDLEDRVSELLSTRVSDLIRMCMIPWYKSVIYVYRSRSC